MDWLRNRRRDKPFMLMFQHKAPHREWAPGPNELTMYDDRDIWEPPRSLTTIGIAARRRSRMT